MFLRECPFFPWWERCDRSHPKSDVIKIRSVSFPTIVLNWVQIVVLNVVDSFGRQQIETHHLPDKNWLKWRRSRLSLHGTAGDICFMIFREIWWRGRRVCQDYLWKSSRRLCDVLILQCNLEWNWCVNHCYLSSMIWTRRNTIFSQHTTQTKYKSYGTRW